MRRARWLAFAAVTVMATAMGVFATGVMASAASVGPYQIINYNSGKCMDVRDHSTSDGAAVQQYTCHRGDNQMWYLQDQANFGYFQIVPQLGNTGFLPTRCLQVYWSNTSGADATSSQCGPPPWVYTDQGWSLLPAGYSSFPTPGAQYRYKFYNSYSHMCLQVENGSLSNNTRVEQATCNNSPQQLWLVET